MLRFDNGIADDEFATAVVVIESDEEVSMELVVQTGEAVKALPAR